MSDKIRLDVAVFERGYAETREKAKALIMAGNVYVNGQKEDKAGTFFDENKVFYIKSRAAANNGQFFPAENFGTGFVGKFNKLRRIKLLAGVGNVN